MFFLSLGCPIIPIQESVFSLESGVSKSTLKQFYLQPSKGAYFYPHPFGLPLPAAAINKCVQTTDSSPLIVKLIY